MESVLVKMVTLDQAVVNVTLATTETPVMEHVEVYAHTCTWYMYTCAPATLNDLIVPLMQSHAVKELRAVSTEIALVMMATLD